MRRGGLLGEKLGHSYSPAIHAQLADYAYGLYEVAPEDLPRVFEKGFTGCNGRTDKRATGIGLYLCRRILEKLGHTIAITSTVGEGTTVRIGLQQDALEVE